MCIRDRKKDSIKTLLLTLWKSEDDKVTKTESGELGSAVSAYIAVSYTHLCQVRRQCCVRVTPTWARVIRLLTFW